MTNKLTPHFFLANPYTEGMIKNIYINGFPLSNEGVSYIKEVQGLTAPTIALQTYNRGGRDGVVLGNPLYRQRVFTVSVAIIVHSPEELLVQKDRLLAAVRLQQYGETQYKMITFELSDGTRRTCEAITNNLDGELKPETSYAMTPLTIQMVARKWYLEGDEYTKDISAPNYGGMAIPMNIPMSLANMPGESDTQIINAGNTESLPQFRIRGPLTGLDLYNQTTEQHLSVTYMLGENEYIDLDSFAHTAIYNRVSNVRGSVSGDWLVLAPGANEIRFLAAAGSENTRATITYKDAYLGI